MRRYPFSVCLSSVKHLLPKSDSWTQWLMLHPRLYCSRSGCSSRWSLCWRRMSFRAMVYWFLADRTARSMISSWRIVYESPWCRLFLSLWRCALWRSGLVCGFESCTVVFLTRHFLFTFSDTLLYDASYSRAQNTTIGLKADNNISQCIMLWSIWDVVDSLIILWKFIAECASEKLQQAQLLLW